MTLFPLHGGVRPSYTNESQRPAPLRSAEPDPLWEASASELTSGSVAADPLEGARRAVGDRLIEAAMRELGRPAGPAETAPSSCAPPGLNEALGVAMQVLAGVDFLTQLEFSAVHQGPRFKACAQALGLAPEDLTPEARERIDASMGQRFTEAAASAQAPVELTTAKQWLHNELFRLTC